MRRKVLALLTLTLLLGGCGSPPSHEAIEQVWRKELMEPHMEAMAELLGPQARRLIANDLQIQEVRSLGDGVYSVEYRSSQQLKKPLDEVAGYTPPNVMAIIRSVFPSGEAGAIANVAGVMELKKTEGGWKLIGTRLQM
jgi:hypothetical protein